MAAIRTAPTTASIAQIDAEPLPGEVGGEQRTLGAGEADLGVASALYAGTQGWDILADALERAARGDGTTLLQLSDAYTGRKPGGTYDNSQAAFFGIGCLDAPAPTIEQLPAVAQRIEQAAPEFGASTTWLSSPCSVWPVPRGGSARAGARDGCTADRGARHVERSRDAVEVGAGARGPARVRKPRRVPRARATPRTRAATSASTTRSTTT